MDTNLIFFITMWALRVSLVLFTLISWKNPKWGVYLICAFLPAYLIRLKGPFDLPMTALEVMILTLFGIWFLKNLKFRRSQICTNVQICDKFLTAGIATFLLAATISMFLSPDLRSAAGIWKAYFIEPLMFLAVFVSVIKKDDIKNVIKAFGFSAFYISLYAFAQKFLGFSIPAPWQTEMRATSIFDFPNAVGLFLAPIIPLIIYVILGDAKRSPGIHVDSPNKSGNDKLTRIILALITILSVFAVIFAKSEGAVVALVAVFFIWLFIKLKKRGKIILSIVGAAAIISILFLSVAPFPQVKEKLLLNDWSGMVRRTVWAETWEMLKDAPVFGANLAGYQTAIVPYHNAKWMEIFLYPHNVVLNFWTETGLLGLLGFILIVWWFYKNNLKTQNSELKIYLLLAMSVLLVHGLVDVPYFKNDLSVLFWTIIGLTLIEKSDKIS